MNSRFLHNDALRRAITANLRDFAVRPAPDGGLRAAAVAVTVVPGAGGEACFVLTFRPASMRSHARQYALPGGRIDQGESPEQAALRELREEVGLILPPQAILGRLDDYPTRSGYMITPVVAWAESLADLDANPHEVAEIMTIGLHELDRPGSPEFISIPESDRPVIRLLLRGDRVHAPTAAVIWQFWEVAVMGRATRVAHLEQPVFAWR